ncbi:MAG: hypothetical protein A4E23_00186 [Methanomethylovorans sp. PtaU1.Bin073]|jgi:integrase|nr:MAG: hypothetical protein A4E23_00186 [Methanomethylovorans sp. PtaU1.Bin073]
MPATIKTQTTIEKLMTDTEFLDLCDTIKARSEGTQRNLAKSLCKYLEMIETKHGKVYTYKDLIAVAKKEQIEIPDIDNRSIGKYISKYPRYLAEQGLAEGTIVLYYNSLMRFYKRKNIILPYNGIDKANVKKSNKYIPKKEDIQNALKHGSILAQAIVLSQVSSGMGTAEILSLTRDDFWNGYDKVTGVTTLNPTRKKTNEHYYTFLNPEASKAVIQMLDEREDDDPSLFGLKNEAAILSMYGRLDEMCGYVQIKGQYGKIRSHNMRKYFNNTMRHDAKAPVDLVDYLSGRKETSTRAAYHEWKPEMLKEEYMGYMEHLYVVTDVIKPDQETLENLQAENRELKEQMAAMKKANQDAMFEIQQLRQSTGHMQSNFMSVVEQLTSAGIVKDIEPDMIPGKSRVLKNGMVETEMVPNPKKRMLVDDPLEIDVLKETDD